MRRRDALWTVAGLMTAGRVPLRGAPRRGGAALDEDLLLLAEAARNPVVT